MIDMTFCSHLVVNNGSISQGFQDTNDNGILASMTFQITYGGHMATMTSGMDFQHGVSY